MHSWDFVGILQAPFGSSSVDFTHSGDTLLYGIENRIVTHDLMRGRPRMLAQESSAMIKILRQSYGSSGTEYFATVDANNVCMIVSPSGHLLQRICFKRSVTCLEFSPNGKWLAVAAERDILLYALPNFQDTWQLDLCATKVGHNHLISCIDWSGDSEEFVTSSLDLTARVYQVDVDDVRGSQIIGQKSALMAAYYIDQDTVISISVGGVAAHYTRGAWLTTVGKGETEPLVHHNVKQEEGAVTTIDNKNWHPTKWTKAKVTTLGGQVKCCSLKNGTLAVGLGNGTVVLYEVKEMFELCRMRLDTSPTTSIQVNADGEWVSCCIPEKSRLVVWEWKSETLIYDHSTNDDGVKNIAMSSETLACGSSDGTVSFWDITNGHRVAKKQDHTGSVNSLVFTPQGNAVFSASSDGTVRGFDIQQYNNFRTLEMPKEITVEGDVPVFTNLSVDVSGELIAAVVEGEEPLAVVWSIQTGRYVEHVSGHGAGMTSLAFDPQISRPGRLATSASDGSVRVWDLFSGGSNPEVLNHDSEVLTICFDPRGNGRLAVAEASAKITIWDSLGGNAVCSIEGLRDIHSGRRARDMFAANNTRAKKNATYGSSRNEGINRDQHIHTMCFTPSGEHLLCGSRRSPRILIYSVEQARLIRAFHLTWNTSLDGIRVELDSRKLGEDGTAVAELDVSDDEDFLAYGVTHYSRKRTLPSVSTGQLADSGYKKEFTVYQVSISKDGSHWAAATSRGVYYYELALHGLDVRGAAAKTFVPINLLGTSQAALASALAERRYADALRIACNLNDKVCIRAVFNEVPLDKEKDCVSSLDSTTATPLLDFLRVALLPKPHGHPNLSKIVRWIRLVVGKHMRHLILKPGVDKSAASVGLLLNGMEEVRRNTLEKMKSNAGVVSYLQTL